MKICNACKESIAIDATKCPKCQSFQKWYKNPGLIALLPILLLFPMLSLFRSSQNRVEFADFKNEITVKKISQDTVLVKDEKMLNIIVEVDNQSEQKWENAVYEVRYLSESGALLNIEKKEDYRFVAAKKAKVKSSIKVPVYDEYAGAKLEVELIDLREDRF